MIALTQCINYLLSVSQHNVFACLSGRLAEHGITPAQYGVLSCLWSEPSLTPSQIGETLHLEASSISGVLERMQKNQLIDRSVDPENRRAIIVSATRKGKALRKPVEKIIDEVNARVMQPYTDEDRQVLSRLLLDIGERNLR